MPGWSGSSARRSGFRDRTTGLQGVAEYFGAALKVLDCPVHGKASVITLGESALFTGLPATILAGRYHSVHVPSASVPASLRVITEADGVVMGIEHVSLPVSAVQFHPESLLTAREGAGIRLIGNLVAHTARVLRARPHLAGRRGRGIVDCPLAEPPAG